MRRSLSLAIVAIALLTMSASAADFADINPSAFEKDDPRVKDLQKMMQADATRRMQEANLRESKSFAAITTKAEWEKYRDVRIQKLRESLGSWPDAPKKMPIHVTRKIEGDGFIIHNLIYESRPGLWVSANLYLPAKFPEKMPGIIISHSHHNGKTEGELQDMGMTWARSGVAVLVPDHLGYNERRQHDFNTAKDYDKPYRVGRQDYYYRYVSNLQLSASGDSLMGWMVWDLMRGVDVLLKQTNIDPDRIILLGAVAGGGDPAGVTAALDNRIACVVPFNFGGWQPESSVLENPDRDFSWFGDGYWESTRGLRNGARDGFAHYVIVGSVAPRKVIYSHEFGWDGKNDPAWPRLQKIFAFYDKDSLRVAHGTGSLKGRPPESSHCNHIGGVHRKMIYPALKEWFGMAIPEEYSKRLPKEDLQCWTEEAKKEYKPKSLTRVIQDMFKERLITAKMLNQGKPKLNHSVQIDVWTKLLGNIVPPMNPKVVESKPEDVLNGVLTRSVMEPEPGIVVPLILITPKDAKNASPVMVMIAQSGKKALLAERGAEISIFLKAGVAVCLVDLRGTGETKPGDSADRGSNRTSISQSNLILGQPVLGAQLRDLRAVIEWLAKRKELDGKNIGVWGDSFAKLNDKDTKFKVPLDADNRPHIAEPGAAELALLSALFDERVTALYVAPRSEHIENIYYTANLYLPHDAITPGGGIASMMLASTLEGWKPDFKQRMKYDKRIDGLNILALDNVPIDTLGAANSLAKSLTTK